MKMPLLHITCPYADCGQEFEVPVALRPKGRTESGDMELSVTADTSEFRVHVNRVHNIVTPWATDEIIEMGLEVIDHADLLFAADMAALDFKRDHPDYTEAEMVRAVVAAIEPMIRADSPRVEIDAALGKPTTCRVWRDDQLVFSGIDLASSITIRGMDRHRLNEIGALALYQLLPINHEPGANAGDLQHTEAQVVIAAVEPLIRDDQKRLDEDALREARRSQLLDLYLEVQTMHEAARRPKVHLPKGGKDAAKAEAYGDVLDVLTRRLDLLVP